MPDRIVSTTTEEETILVMADKDLGAAMVCGDLLRLGRQIDPYAEFGGLTYLMWLDSLGIYGIRLYELYRNVCKGSLSTMAAVVRAWRLGGVAKEEIVNAIKGRNRNAIVKRASRMVAKELPDFNFEVD